MSDSVPGFEVTGWYGLLFPSGTPAPIVARMQEAVVASTRSEDMRARLQALGAEPIGSTSAAFAHLLKAEVRRWAEAVRASGARAD